MSDDVRICSIPDCNNPAREGQRYCADCHAKYMRAWRAKKKRAQQQLVEELFRLRKQNSELKRRLQTPAS